MSKLFTSEGPSGRAVTELTCETVMMTGRALAVILRKDAGRPAKILIANDARLSSDIFTASFAAGCCSAGAEAKILGTLPTPAVSYLTEKYSADAGVMITASHNTFEFNGIRIFDSRGFSLPLEVWDEIERLVTTRTDLNAVSGGEDIGRIVYEKNAEWDYVRSMIKRIDTDLGRMRVAIDCANGAASYAAEKFFRGIGAEVSLINNTPDGRNINRDCGTVDTASLRKYVAENRCHAGVALDGDGGRCIMIDEKGGIIDGDRLTAILASDMKKNQKLSANTCVVSQSTNLGFFRWAKDNGIVVSAVPSVGCRHITERMLLGDYNLGGSPSGHIILLGQEKTADGMFAAARILEILAKSGRKMSELGAVYEPYPQVVLNIPLRREYVGRWQDHPAVSEMIAFCQQKLEGEGRVFVRESSTSPVLRIIAEGRDGETVWQYAHAIAKTVTDNVGIPEEEE